MGEDRIEHPLANKSGIEVGCVAKKGRPRLV
jgi:hypothetical protein